MSTLAPGRGEVMTVQHITRKVAWPARQMFDLVADIESYPEFLPWCSAARVENRRTEGQCEVLDAELVLSFKAFRESYRSRVVIDPDKLTIDVSNLDGFFKSLESQWTFVPADGGCEVRFFIAFEFKSYLLGKVVGVAFDMAMKRIIHSFEERARFLHQNEGRITA